MDQEDKGDHNPPWWTRRGFNILLMSLVKWIMTTIQQLIGGVVEILIRQQPGVYILITLDKDILDER